MTKRKPIKRDESYILDLCDELLGQKALRQCRFDFLRGDPGKRGVGTKLPVDAYYKALELVIEYRERQHSEPVKFFDRRVTVSGGSRREQRAKYDQRRRDELPRHGIKPIEFSYDEFECDARKRLIRDESKDKQVVRAKLEKWIRH
jgi:hypothetical protein